MPRVPFTALPDDARVWVFASNRVLSSDEEANLLSEADRFLGSWQAHGSPLTCARDFRYGCFLTIGVDQSTAGASGCSIDGLFRSLRSLEPTLGTSLLSGGRVLYRDMDGVVQSVARDEFTALAAHGAIGRETTVFDTTVTTMAAWRTKFETQVQHSWHLDLVPELAG